MEICTSIGEHIGLWYKENAISIIVIFTYGQISLNSTTIFARKSKGGMSTNHDR